MELIVIYIYVYYCLLVFTSMAGDVILQKNWKMSLCKKTSKRDGVDRFFYQDTFLLDFRALILLAVSNKNIARD